MTLTTLRLSISLTRNVNTGGLGWIDIKHVKKLKDDVFQPLTQAYSDYKKDPSAPNRSRTYDLPITSSDELPLSYRRLVVANCRPLN